MAKKDEAKARPPIPGGYPDTKITGPAVQRTGHLAEAEPEAPAEEAPAEESEAPAEPEEN